ncbi:MAG: hypothetical protein RL722_817 [Pseudomonadota bacterium]|jgi:ribosomal protein S18 acetylase RimI-like enzyme
MAGEKATVAGATEAPFRIELLGPGHEREHFQCGEPALDHYLRQQAGQDARRRVSACFVAVEIVSHRLAGYYTLSAGGLALNELPEPLARRLPRYPSVPIARLGRLAVDGQFQGRRLGAALLADAMWRASRSEVAVHAMVVDAKDDAAINFYRHHGFMHFGSLPRQLMLPLQAWPGLRP